MKDYTGLKVGKLTVIKEVERNKHNQRVFLCECECGNTTKVETHALTHKTKPRISCGCVTGHYPKGHVPHNKGVHKLLSEKCLETAFKPGDVPANALPSNTPRVVGKRKEWVATVDEKIVRKNARGKEIKCRKRTSYARALWEMEVGEIPKGKIVWNRGDKDMEPLLANLELITRAESIKRNRKN